MSAGSRDESSWGIQPRTGNREVTITKVFCLNNGQLLSSGSPWLGSPGPEEKNQVKLANILGSSVCLLAESPVLPG